MGDIGEERERIIAVPAPDPAVPAPDPAVPQREPAS
jgi:hypothetical protein